MILHWFNMGENVFNVMRFISIQMMYTSWGALGFAMYQNCVYQHKSEESKEKYKLFAPWKWWIVLFEISLCSQLLITPYYWILLRKLHPFENTIYTKIEIVTDHTLPLVLLLVELTMNQIPFIFRHIYIGGLVVVTVILVNLIYTKVSGSPVYPMMNWNTVIGILIPLCVPAVGVLVFFLAF